MTHAPAQSNMFACHTCSAGILNRDLEPGDELHCKRCGEVLKRGSHFKSLHPAWALSTTGLILLVLANVYPVMVFDVAGYTQSNLIITGVIGLAGQGFRAVAALVLFCAIAAPALYLAAVWYVAASCCIGKRWPIVDRVAHFAERILPWSLVPVFAISCFVAVVKLDMLGTVTWEAGIIWIILLSVCCMFVNRAFDKNFVEEQLSTLR
jgi:paraquat-inducible protein A